MLRSMKYVLPKFNLAPAGRWSTLLPLLGLCLGAAPSARAEIDRQPLQESLRRDAAIRAIDFVDAKSGWAAGEGGALWHTDDGGKHWQMQKTPALCNLETVSFIDAKPGWAAGGNTEPYTHGSRGVLLRTDDGGVHWSVWTKDPLPKIKKIKFSNLQQGIAWTARSPLYPHGLLVTEDGGRSWSALRDEGASGWECAAFLNATTGCVASANQRGSMRNGRLHAAHAPANAARWHCLCMRDAEAGYALDASGVLHATQDGGATWQARSPAVYPAGFTPHSMETKGTHIWIAGNPGNYILASDDGGITWQRHPTGQPFPLWDLHFIDDGVGWAAGDFGSILFTDDGGGHWSIQRQARERVAVLGIFKAAPDVPLEALAQLSVAEGYSSGVTLFGHSAISPTVPLDDPYNREREAVILAGINTVDQTFAARNGMVDPSAVATERAIAAFESHLVRQLRLYRPDVLLTHPTSSRREDPLGFQINQAVFRAVERAAQVTGNASIEAPAWRVRKVYAALPAKRAGTLAISTRRWELNLGQTPAEFVRPARTLLNSFPEPGVDTVSFALLLNQLPQGRGGGQFFAGIHVVPGGPARRALIQPERQASVDPRREESRNDVLRAILASAGAGQPSLSAWRTQIHQAASQLTTHQVARVLVDVASEQFVQGKGPLAAETLALLIDHTPNDPLATAAWNWLLTYRASGEFLHRFGEAETDSVQPVATEIGGDAAVPTSATAWGDRLERTRPDLFADPRIQFALAAAYRRDGETRRADRTALVLARAQWLPTYCQRGTEEISLAPDRVEAAAIPRWVAERARTKPYLDGRLNESCWQRAAEGAIRLEERTTAAPLSTVVRVCFDEQYLYFGIECEKSPGVTYKKPPRARRRDMPLATHDRLQICIDIDRDYATSYRFTVDSRGCTHDQLWKDPTWDPAWFVATTETDAQWVCELAIPHDALSDQKRSVDRIWACGVQRIVPGRAFSSWTLPASPHVDPAGFGHLQLPAWID